MRTSFFLSLITALTILVIPAKAEWISPADYQQMLGSGIDVDWWQEGNGYQVQNWDDVIYDFRQAGVQHLRITIEQEVMRPADFVILDEEINHCIRHGIIVLPIQGDIPHASVNILPDGGPLWPITIAIILHDSHSIFFQSPTTRCLPAIMT